MSVDDLPSRKAIATYWSIRIPESSIAVDWSDDPANACWACARRARPGCRDLHRCHVVPRAQGGTDTVENLLILCDECHRLAPDVPDPGSIWTWIRNSRRDPIGRLLVISDMAISVGLSERDVPRLVEILSRCGLHHGRFSDSTIRWAAEQAVAQR